MIKILSTLFLAIFAFSALAIESGYKCKVVYKRDRSSVAALKLPRYKAGRLTVDYEACTYNEYSSLEVCRVKGHNLIVGEDPRRSLLLTRAGKSYAFSCRSFGEQEESEDDPGHGGSTHSRDGNH